jgi:hypothetical protein
VQDCPRVRGWLVMVVCLLCAPDLPARVAIVRTRTGGEWSGHARFVAGGVVLANLERGHVITVPETNVAELIFPALDPLPLDEFAEEVLPPEWREMEVGGGHSTGGTRVQRRSFTVRGAGAGFNGTDDFFHYVFKSVRGDSEIVARLGCIQHTPVEARAALMMREGMGGQARNVAVAATMWRGGAWQMRAAEGRATQVLAQPDVRTGWWLKLRRRGNEFSGFKSPDGRRWTLIEKVTLEMRAEFHVGLAVASGREDVLHWTTFDHVREAPKLIREDFTPEVELTSGSVVAGRPLWVDGDEMVFAGGPRVVRVPMAAVARIAYAPLNAEMAWKARASRPGVWVGSGDFFDAEFQGVRQDKLRMSSVLYGLRTFDVDEEVQALVLRGGVATRAAVELRAVDGSVLLATAMSFVDGDVVLREPALGEVRVPAFQIAELRRR